MYSIISGGLKTALQALLTTYPDDEHLNTLVSRSYRLSWVEYEQLTDSYFTKQKVTSENIEKLIAIAQAYLLFEFQTQSFTRLSNLLVAFSKKWADAYENWETEHQCWVVCSKRLHRLISIEEFELWLNRYALQAGEVFPMGYFLAGYTLLHEKNSEYSIQIQFWMEKAMRKAPQQPIALLAMTSLVQALFQFPNRETLIYAREKINQLADQFQAFEEAQIIFIDLTMQSLIEELALQPGVEVRRLILYELKDHCLKEIARKERYSAEIQGYLYYRLAYAYFQLANLGEPILAQEALRQVDAALILNEVRPDIINVHQYQQLKYCILLLTGEAVVAYHSLKDLAVWFRKDGNYQKYAETLCYAVAACEQAELWDKAIDYLAEQIESLVKKLPEGGCETIVILLGTFTKILNHALYTNRLKFIAERGHHYFQLFVRFNDYCYQNPQQVGSRLWERYVGVFRNCKILANNEIHVYLSYHQESIKVLAISAQLAQNTHTGALAQDLLNAIADSKNPANIFTGKWKCFADEPVKLRNRILNQCVSIARGDLPRAAELLDFSYRNLRSYLSQNEVDRLGNFLTDIQTEMPALEQGIRKMLYELHLQGTLYEIIFDLPIFLVKYHKGFSLSTFVEALDLKYNTASKYLKGLTQIGLIRCERLGEEKSFYTLEKETIFTRACETALNKQDK